MLYSFPTPYPDELLYSVFARYHLFVGNYSAKHTTEELFGTRTIRSVYDLPGNIDAIAENLNNPYYTSDYLIQNHTLFPYYNSFLLPMQSEKAKNLIKGNYGDRLHTTTGISPSNIKPKKNFMHCAQCIEEDFDYYGETYWHRTHQLPGVFFCHKHNTILYETSVSFKQKNQHEYIIANEETTKKIRDFVTFSNEDRIILLKISKLSHELLQGHFSLNDNFLYKEYKYRLINKGFCTLKGYVDRQGIINSFCQFYGSELLDFLNSSVETSERNWLTEIFQKHRKSFHPIRHLLVIIYFNDELINFFSNYNREIEPYGKGPWYCLNPVCPNFKKKVITNIIITRDIKKKIPVGTFNCECGFRYSRSGYDRNEIDLFRIGQIKDYGEVWKLKLKELIKSGDSLNKVARVLQCDPKTVKRQAALLGIKFAKNDKELEDLRNKKSQIQAKVLLESEITEKEKEWLDLKKNNPNLTITSLRSLRPDLYSFLYRTNREFLFQNSRRQDSKNDSNVNRVDWEVRDKEFLLEVIQLIKMWDIGVSKLTRITLTAIGKKIEKLAVIDKNREKLPETIRYIKSVEEDIDTFQIRRLHFEKDKMKKNGEEVVAWKLRRKAGLKENVTERVKLEILALTEQWDY